jgi:hypothetical protein
MSGGRATRREGDGARACRMQPHTGMIGLHSRLRRPAPQVPVLHNNRLVCSSLLVAAECPYVCGVSGLPELPAWGSGGGGFMCPLPEHLSDSGTPSRRHMSRRLPHSDYPGQVTVRANIPGTRNDDSRMPQADLPSPR